MVLLLDVSDPSGAWRLSLRLRFAADGTPTVRGAVRRRRADGGAPDTVLVAERRGARASCADADGDGVPGLTGVGFVGRNPETGERVPVALATAAGEDIDADGSYVVALRVGDAEERVAVAARTSPPRRRRDERPRRR